MRPNLDSRQLWTDLVQKLVLWEENPGGGAYYGSKIVITMYGIFNCVIEYIVSEFKQYEPMKLQIESINLR